MLGGRDALLFRLWCFALIMKVHEIKLDGSLKT